VFIADGKRERRSWLEIEAFRLFPKAETELVERILFVGDSCENCNMRSWVLLALLGFVGDASVE
jgi:predicted lipoprotein